MAGESPDRSERERSSGETTEEAGPVPPARRPDPRASYAAPEEPESAGDARLRDAVAAWVSGTEPEEPTPDEDAGRRGDDERDGGEDGAEDGGSGEDAAEPGDGPQSDLPVREPRNAAPGESAAEDTPTTVFGAPRDQAREGAAPGKESAAARAERMTTAFFGTSHKAETDASRAVEEAEDVVDAATDGTGQAETAADVSADAAGAENDGEANGSGAAAEPADDEGPVEPDEPDDAVSDDDPEVPPKDRATAVLRAPGADTAAGRTDQPTTAIRLPENRAARPGTPGDEETPDDEETPGDGGTPGDRPPSGPTTREGAGTGTDAQAGDAVAPAKAAPTPTPADAGSEAGRSDSRFVPLRSSDDARAPGPLPDEEPSGVGGGLERTKTQPVPDPAPLDLLAQLTNTPPPPQTPLRTAARRVKIWTPLVALLAIVIVIVQAVRPLPEPELTLTADSAHTFAGTRPSLPWPAEGQAFVEVTGVGVLGSSGKQRPVPIGSVAKTMTAYVVLQEHPLREGKDGPVLTIDKKAEAGGKRGAGNGNESVLDGVRAGDHITLRQAISALMIPSANNIARLLARWDSGSEAAFVEKMNATAEELGMANTTYTDPSGLRESTVSTAADQVKLGKEVVRMPQLTSITKLPFWKNPFTGEQMRNWNSLVPFDGAIGIKTGTTTAAGGNLLFAGFRDIGGTRQLIVGAVLGQHTPSIIDTVTTVSKKLLIAAGDTLTSETIVRKGDVVGYLDDGLGGRTPVVATGNVQAVGYPGARVELALEPGEGAVPHVAPAGKKVGVLTVGGGPGAVEVPVALQKDLTEPGFGDKLVRVL